MRIIPATSTVVFLLGVCLPSQFVLGQSTEAIGENDRNAESRAGGTLLAAATSRQVDTLIKGLIDNAGSERRPILFDKLILYLNASGQIKTGDTFNTQELLGLFRLTNEVLEAFRLWESVETGKRKAKVFFRDRNYRIYKKFKQLDTRSNMLSSSSNNSMRQLFEFVRRKNDNVVFSNLVSIKSKHPTSKILRDLKLYVVMYLFWQGMTQRWSRIKT